MKINQKITAVLVSLAFVFALSLSAEAQNRRTSAKNRTASKGKRTPARRAAASGSEAKMTSEKVSSQIKNVTKFLYALGGIARDVEDIDTATRAKRVSQETIEKNDRFKQSIMLSIRNLRAGLASLEVEFRTKPALRGYLGNIQGITDLSGRAEDLAIEGKFTDSGKALLLVIDKLADTLAALP